MRLRAEQVRAGHRLGGATVTRVRAMLDRGTVRITVEHPDGDAAPGDLADGTFSFLTGDVLEVDRLPA
jgi:hypothetical protein